MSKIILSKQDVLERLKSLGFKEEIGKGISESKKKKIRLVHEKIQHPIYMPIINNNKDTLPKNKQHFIVIHPSFEEKIPTQHRLRKILKEGKAFNNNMNDFPKEFNEKSNAKTKTHFGINFHPETDDDLLMIISLISDNIFHKEKYLLNLNINRFVESDLKEKFQEFSSFDEMKNIDREIVPQMTADDEDFERKVNFFFINKHFLLDKPKGQESPSAQAVTVKKYIRDPKVAAYVLKVAEGICGYCEKTAPFNRVDGSPYLETHHIKPLAEGGADTVENCVALCPNCHRAIHSSGDRNKRLVKLMER